MEVPGVSLNEDGQGQLVLRFTPPKDAGRSAVDATGLRELAGALGYAELAYDDRSLAAAAIKIRRREPCALVVARRTDTEYEVEISPDRMTAWLTVIPGCGGRPPSAPDAMSALARYNLLGRVDAGAVKAAVERCGERHVVAQGVPPKPGRDAWLEPLVEVNRQRHPQVDSDGKVDLYDLGSIPSVSPGEPLMRRHPPVPGEAGVDVCGLVVPAPPVKDVAFGARLPGAYVSRDDPDLLLAGTAGQPILLRDGIAVEPLVRYENIDVSVGHVRFPGRVEVRGDIRSGIKVHADGDVVVRGVIESAEVVAGGDVKVEGGIIGHSLPPGQTHQNARVPTARISAQGNVIARYIENALVEAKAVHVLESIVQSEVTGLEQVVAGAKGRKGRILGGKVRATRMVAADFVGGVGSGPTHVAVGISPRLQRELEEHRRRLDAKLKEHDDVTKLVKLLKARADKRELYEKACATLAKVTAEISEEIARKRELDAEAKLAESAKVVVGERVHAGVTICLGRQARYVNEDMGRGVFQLDEGGALSYGTLAQGR